MNTYKIINEYEAEITQNNKIFTIRSEEGNIANFLEWFLSDTKLKKHEYEAATQHNLELTKAV